MTQPNIDETQVREAAYYFWLDEGQPEGRDQEFWLKAVDALNTPAPKAKKARKAPAKKPAAKAKAAPKAKAEAAPAKVAKAKAPAKKPAAKKPAAKKAAAK